VAFRGTGLNKRCKFLLPGCFRKVGMGELGLTTKNANRCHESIGCKKKVFEKSMPLLW
jgi:hypothetical protein